ncbi:MAG: TetR/AcrR family transcriptional regulator [Candidatus Binataceae bacterium]
MSTRDSLISVGAKLLDRGGIAAVTLRAVGAGAGVSHNAPYKHFADKEDLLAAIAARELAWQREAMQHTDAAKLPPLQALNAMMRGYVRWALKYPARFKLTFGSWLAGTDELTVAAESTRALLVEVVKAAQASGDLPKGDPERLASLFLALAHGAADQALAGHLSREGKGHASPEQLVDDLFGYISAKRTTPKSRPRRRKTK